MHNSVRKNPYNQSSLSNKKIRTAAASCHRTNSFLYSRIASMTKRFVLSEELTQFIRVSILSHDNLSKDEASVITRIILFILNSDSNFALYGVRHRSRPPLATRPTFCCTLKEAHGLETRKPSIQLWLLLLASSRIFVENSRQLARFFTLHHWPELAKLPLRGRFLTY